MQINNVLHGQGPVFQGAVSPQPKGLPISFVAPTLGSISWDERAIRHLEQCEARLDHMIPNSLIQNKIDEMGSRLEEKFAPLVKFNDWLEQSNQGSWYRQLALFLVKLPVKAVRNIIRLLYSIIKSICYGAVHPLKAGVNLVKLFVRLAKELTKPETWSKMGAGVMGAGAGNALITLNPAAIIGVGIGGAMVVGGLTWGYFEGGREAVINQLKQLPESLLTGFCMGLIFGAIAKAHPAHKQPALRPTDKLPTCGELYGKDCPPGWENVHISRIPELDCHFWDEECLAQYHR